MTAVMETKCCPKILKGLDVDFWDMFFLVTTSVSLRYDTFQLMKSTTVGHGLLLVHGLLDGLSHPTTLELQAPLPEFTSERGLQTCPVFSNLTSMVWGDWSPAAYFYLLHRLLHRPPKLNELSLKLEMEKCSTCKDAESALQSTRRAPLSGSGNYPCIKRIKIHCREEDSRVSSLVQALLPLASGVKISIEHRRSMLIKTLFCYGNLPPFFCSSPSECPKSLMELWTKLGIHHPIESCMVLLVQDFAILNMFVKLEKFTDLSNVGRFTKSS
uniref:Uncharacterized protein n=1 Tax=Aegilops tauschii TaxID=37682 RepID=M8BUA3_AEGTA